MINKFYLWYSAKAVSMVGLKQYSMANNTLAIGNFLSKDPNDSGTSWDDIIFQGEISDIKPIGGYNSYIIKPDSHEITKSLFHDNKIQYKIEPITKPCSHPPLSLYVSGYNKQGCYKCGCKSI